MELEGVSIGGDNGNVSESPPPVGNSESPESLASPFLNEVSPDHRAIVAPYIKKWDAGVTKKFQDYAGKLKQYEKYGDPTQLDRYYNFGRNFERDPEAAFRLMWQGMQTQFGDNFDTELARILELQEELEMSEDYGQDFDGADYQEPIDDNTIFQQNVSSELEELRAWKEEQVAAQQSAEENQQLDSVLDAMHTKYGDFDNNWILVRLAEHGNIDRAVKEWNQMLSRYSQGTQRQAPKVMGGQGGVPSGQIDTKSLRGKDRREIVANMLEQAG